MGVFSATKGETALPVANTASAQHVVQLLRYGSLAVLGGYTVALCYRVGLFRKILPTHVNAKLEQTVDAVKAKTEPVGNVKRYAMARNHLLRAYGWASSGMLTAVAGVALFCAYPKIPIALPLAATALCSIVLVLPKTTVIQAGRILAFYTATLCGGYCFGPIGWAMQDTLVVFLMLVGCTMTGLCVPLFLTRGMVSYTTSSQLLSLALSLSLVTAPKESKSYSPFKYIKTQPGVQVILNGDVNVLLTMQLIGNLGITLFHTLPVIIRYVSSGDSDEDLAAKVDPLREAFCICAGWGYLNYRLVRSCCRVLFRRILSENTRNAHKGSEGSWTMAAGAVTDGRQRGGGVDIASSISAGVVSLLWYVRIISVLQHGDPEVTLNRARVTCAKLSPVGMLLGNGSK